MLHTPSGRNSYCGPYAVAAITKLTTDQVAREINSARAYPRPIRGTTWHDLRPILYRAGLVVRYGIGFRRSDAPTLAGWLRQRTPEIRAADWVLLSVTGHWVLVKGNKITCSKTRRWDWIKQYPWRRCRVRAVYPLYRQPHLEHSPPKYAPGPPELTRLLQF